MGVCDGKGERTMERKKAMIKRECAMAKGRK